MKEGDWAYIETHKGQIRQRVKLNADLDPRVIFADYAWWFPEKEAPGHGWKESNINMLTDNAYEACDPDGACDPATVTLVVSPVNDAPVAEDDEFTVAAGGAGSRIVSAISPTVRWRYSP